MGVNSAGLFNSSPIMEVSHAFGRRAGTGQAWPDKSTFMRASYSFYGWMLERLIQWSIMCVCDWIRQQWVSDRRARAHARTHTHTLSLSLSLSLRYRWIDAYCEFGVMEHYWDMTRSSLSPSLFPFFIARHLSIPPIFHSSIFSLGITLHPSFIAFSALLTTPLLFPLLFLYIPLSLSLFFTVMKS